MMESRKIKIKRFVCQIMKRKKLDADGCMLFPEKIYLIRNILLSVNAIGKKGIKLLRFFGKARPLDPPTEFTFLKSSLVPILLYRHLNLAYDNC